jgi:uncharacterized damage-inducible protein DinB
MGRHALLVLAAISAAVASQAQTPMTPVSEAKAAYTAVKNNLINMAVKTPEEHYSFKPVPEIRTFGELVAHVADNQVRGCSSVKGEQRQGNAASLKTKAELVEALKASFTECDAAWDTVTDATAAQTVKTARGERSRLGAMTVFILAHDNEEYGYMAVYLRLKGIVPPSSEPRKP